MSVAENAGLSERTNVVFMGTNVRSGSAKVLIVQTGAQTAFGQIADRLTLRPPENEFERGIKQTGLPADRSHVRAGAGHLFLQCAVPQAGA